MPGRLFFATWPAATPRLKGKRIVSQNEIDSIVCKWIYELLEDKLEVQDVITNTHRELEELCKRL